MAELGPPQHDHDHGHAYTAFALEEDQEHDQELAQEHQGSGLKREDSFAALERRMLHTLQQTDPTTSPITDVFHKLEHLAATTHAPAPQSDQAATMHQLPPDLTETQTALPVQRRLQQPTLSLQPQQPEPLAPATDTKARSLAQDATGGVKDVETIVRDRTAAGAPTIVAPPASALAPAPAVVRPGLVCCTITVPYRLLLCFAAGRSGF